MWISAKTPDANLCKCVNIKFSLKTCDYISAVFLCHCSGYNWWGNPLLFSPCCSWQLKVSQDCKLPVTDLPHAWMGKYASPANKSRMLNYSNFIGVIWSVTRCSARHTLALMSSPVLSLCPNLPCVCPPKSKQAVIKQSGLFFVTLLRTWYCPSTSPPHLVFSYFSERCFCWKLHPRFQTKHQIWSPESGYLLWSNYVSLLDIKVINR